MGVLLELIGPPVNVWERVMDTDARGWMAVRSHLR